MYTSYTYTTYPTILVPMDSDDLVRDIYTQLLELYAYDLEVEVLSEKLKNVAQQPSIQPINPNNPLAPYPWDRTPANPNPWTQPWRPGDAPIYYGPPYKVTCEVKNVPTEEHKYSEEWDAWYDPEKNEWLETKCSDPNCHFCVGRPERPLP